MELSLIAIFQFLSQRQLLLLQVFVYPPRDRICSYIHVHLCFPHLFFFKNFYLFIFVCAASSLLCGLFSPPLLLWWGLSSCGAQTSHCKHSSCCGAQAPGHTGFGSCSSRAPEHRLSSSVAYGIFPDQGSNPCLLHGQADSVPLSHQGSLSSSFLNLNGSKLYIPFCSLFLSLNSMSWSKFHNST